MEVSKNGFMDQILSSKLNEEDSIEEIIQQAVRVKPSKLQHEWQKLEFIAFIHFGMNTFINMEWSKGIVSASTYKPTEIDADQ